jgi:phosphoglycolate phosphatase
MGITTILCDLDGTLVDSRRDIVAAFQFAWEAVVGGMPPDAALIAQHIGKPLAVMLEEVGAALSSALLTCFITAYRSAYSEQKARLTRTYPRVVLTLQELSAFTLAIVTTKEPDQAHMVLQRLALGRFFQHIQGGTLGLRLKPAPDCILAALSTLLCAPQDALMVGDTADDIAAGKAAGTLTCAVTYGFGTREALLKAAPNYLIDNFCDLPELAQELRGRVSGPGINC